MATFPSNVWVRKPVIDGYTSLDDAMALLGQGRDEVAAIQTELGTDPSTNAYNTLAERLKTRLSRSGNPRGRVHPARRVNTDGDMATPEFEPISGWWEKEPGTQPLYVFPGISVGFTTVNNTVTWEGSFVYDIRPRLVIAKYVSQSSSPRVGTVTVSSLGRTGFDTRTQAYQNDLATWGNPDRLFWIVYFAVGGRP